MFNDGVSVPVLAQLPIVVYRSGWVGLLFLVATSRRPEKREIRSLKTRSLPPGGTATLAPVLPPRVLVKLIFVSILRPCLSLPRSAIEES